jgi:hypothetical protein
LWAIAAVPGAGLYGVARYPLAADDFRHTIWGDVLIVLDRDLSYRNFKEAPMFDSLADRIREDEHKEVNSTERIIRYVVIAVVSVVIFGGLYYGVRMLG